MLFKQFGDPSKPTVMLIHGGGLSWWMWQPQIKKLEQDYHVITPILDGHGDAAKTEFTSIENAAEKIITYIKDNCNGNVLALCGLSIGAQIVVEVLARESAVTKKAIIESAMVIPMKLSGKWVNDLSSVSYPLINKRWFARLQAKQMYISDDMFESYFSDSKKMPKQSFLNMMNDNSRYTLPQAFQNITAEVVIICGAQELGVMKQSAQLISKNAPNSIVKIIPHCGHGVSIKYPDIYILILKALLKNRVQEIKEKQLI